mmetsp:Transcript_25129/g.54844  ORF Transcript_25129/g.54844 Transcript_25129/m.54844 type:complete len:346 (+) Transcript_25129:1373-2410(+)
MRGRLQAIGETPGTGKDASNLRLVLLLLLLLFLLGLDVVRTGGRCSRSVLLRGGCRCRCRRLVGRILRNATIHPIRLESLGVHYRIQELLLLILVELVDCRAPSALGGGGGGTGGDGRPKRRTEEGIAAAAIIVTICLGPPPLVLVGIGQYGRNVGRAATTTTAPIAAVIIITGQRLSDGLPTPSITGAGDGIRQRSRQERLLLIVRHPSSLDSFDPLLDGFVAVAVAREGLADRLVEGPGHSPSVVSPHPLPPATAAALGFVLFGGEGFHNSRGDGTARVGRYGGLGRGRNVRGYVPNWGQGAIGVAVFISIAALFLILLLLGFVLAVVAAFPSFVLPAAAVFG